MNLSRAAMSAAFALTSIAAFAADYPNVRLASTRFQTTSGARTEFVIECR